VKKSISILAILAIVATGAFAQGFPLSMAAGGGALFDYSLNNGLKFSDGIDNDSIDLQNLSFGGFGFFDATYAELDINFAYGLLTWATEESGKKLKPENFGNVLQLGFSLLGKYPIGLGGFTLFPLLGADYNLVLSSNDKNGKSRVDPGEFSQLGFLAGVGLDFPFSSALFLRAEALFHLRLPSKRMNDTLNNTRPDVDWINPTYAMGPRIKIGVGYKIGGAGPYMLINADTLNVRSKPSSDSSVVGVLARDTRVEVLEKSGTWWKIKSGTIQGYVNSAYLKEAN